MSLIVLNFHGIGEPHAGVPMDERPYWLSQDLFCDLLDRIAAEYDPQEFAYTFDDGNASDILAAEMLAERGAAGRFFVLAGRLGDEHYLSGTDLRQLKEMGMIVGLHGRSHVDWRACDDTDMHVEIDVARSDLEAALGARIDEVAIPFGRYNRRVIAKLWQARFERIHTSDGGLTIPEAKVWNRNTLRNDMDEAVLHKTLSGQWSRAQNLKRAVRSMMKRHVF